jgi:hypothetical protein
MIDCEKKGEERVVVCFFVCMCVYVLRTTQIIDKILNLKNRHLLLINDICICLLRLSLKQRNDNKY